MRTFITSAREILAAWDEATEEERAAVSPDVVLGFELMRTAMEKCEALIRSESQGESVNSEGDAPKPST